MVFLMQQPKLNNLLLDINNHIATVTLNRPQFLNVFNVETLHEMNELLNYLNDHSGVKVMVLKSNSKKAFTAGADVKKMSEQDSSGARRFAELGHGIARKLETLNQPVIVALNGYVLGGGVEFSCACDIRIASEDAVFSQPEIDIGIIPGWGGTQRLINIVGPGKAKELIYTGQRIGVHEALEIGLVDHVVPNDELESTANALASIIARKSRVALIAAKKAINKTFDTGLEKGLEYEIQMWAELFDTYDQDEGMRAFLEKREPVFKDK